MKIKTKYILLCTAALLASCQERLEPTYSVGADDNAIVLAAGISDGGGGVVTRAVANPDANHSSHVKFTQGTKAALKVNGIWLGKGYTENLVSKTTTATIGAETAANSKHNSLSMSPQLYWDDYGSADPANIDAPKGTATAGTGGRAKGLTIYGAAVNGVTDAAPTVSNWTALAWNVGEVGDNDAINQTSGWAAKDLLTSNNVVYSSTESEDNAYKFEDRASGKLLEFTHAMTKVTVELTAGAGFADAKFVNKPEVTLLGFNYTGTVSIEAKTSTATADTKTNIKAHLAEVVTASGGTWSDAPATWAASHKTKYDALVFPGNQFTATIAAEEPHKPTSSTDILKIDADGNIYTVTAAQLVKAIVGTSTTGTPVNGTLEQGKNYVLNITVNKTGIDVEATIKDWVDVTAANEAPVINISDAYGHDGTGFNRNFDLYRSTAVNGSYLIGISGGNHTVVNYVPEAGSDPVVPAHYELATQMYWPNHSTHYFFRGIWPLVDSKDGSSQQLGPTSSQVKENSIEVANVAYKQGYYPSDLMIGIPRKNDGSYDETCKVAGHDKSAGANGICATEGKIRMNFQYAMSQVIVNLTTSDGGDKVIFDTNTKVEIIGGYTTGEIKLSDESSDFAGKTVTDYVMNRANVEVHTGFHDAIIPQSLEDADHKATLKFRITVKSGETYDKYETVLGIKDIQVQEDGDAKKNITAWEPGKKYTYTLQITKSGVKVEATLKDWITVTASEPVWF